MSHAVVRMQLLPLLLIQWLRAMAGAPWPLPEG